MRYRLAALLCCLSLPAQALEVTNLDKVPHQVLYESAGSQQLYTIEPDRTEYLHGTNGFVSLVNKTKKSKPSNDRLYAQGILSGIIGAERSEHIPADANDIFVIWPDGRFGLQGRRHNGRFSQ